jgi:DGQHR domain-containing protein
MDRNLAYQLYGPELDLGVCLVARNLNLLTLRGSARLDRIAVISEPDVADQIHNPEGTQRDTIEKHARDIFAYALNSMSATNTEPKGFPDILLNVRDLAAVEFYNPENPDELIDFTSFGDEGDYSSRLLGVKVLLEQIHIPKQKRQPAISRIDGNHRLSGVELFLDDSDEPITREALEEMPFVPYSLFVGLDVLQEARLFVDVNDRQVGVKPADLANLEYRLTTTNELKSDPQKLPLYIAVQLAKDGGVFEKMVFSGGSRQGLNDKGIKPLITINALRAAIAIQLRSGSVVYRSEQFGSNADAVVALVEKYWRAVKNTFPAEWVNKRDFILLQSIGLNGFAEFGGVLAERAGADGSAEIADFERYLAPIKSSVKLDRSQFAGIAGAGGASVVANRLKSAASPAAVNLERLLKQNRAETSLEEKL